MDARGSRRQQQQGASAPTSESSSARHWVIDAQQRVPRGSRMMHSDAHLPGSRDDRGAPREFVAHMNFYNGFPDDFDHKNLS